MGRDPKKCQKQRIIHFDASGRQLSNDSQSFELVTAGPRKRALEHDISPWLIMNHVYTWFICKYTHKTLAHLVKHPNA